MSSTAQQYEYRYQQDQPATICQAPEAGPEEYGTANKFYGIGELMREYARLPIGEPLPFGVEHFVPYDVDELHQQDIKDGLPVFLATTSRRAEVYRAAGVPKAIATGFALYYAIHLYERRHGRSATPRRGTIVFPHKSTKLLQRDFAHEVFADWLVALPADYHPVVVNLYWADYIAGKHAIYEGRGLKVVSCGHLYDHQFLLRLYDLCRQFRFACGNSVASSFPLSVLCGCQFFYHPTPNHTERSGDVVTHFQGDPTLDSPLTRQALELAPFPPKARGIVPQLKLARKLAGGRHVRFPWTLRRIYRDALKRLTARRGAGLDFSEGTSPGMLHAWLPKGIQVDGWVSREASLAVPPVRIGSCLEIVLEFPNWAGFSRMHFEVGASTGKRASLKMYPAAFVLMVPLQESASDQRVTWVFQEDFHLPDQDARRVSARFIRFRLHEGVSAVKATLTALPQQSSLTPA